VQTLTKAMTSILCRGLNGAKLQDVLEVPADFVPRIIGAELVRLRSQTVYYVLSRMKTAVKMFMDRRRAAAAEAA
jgi:cysteine desulfuration protein SufE